MKPDTKHVYYLNKILELQKELKQAGLDETSEVLKLALLTLYSDMDEGLIFEELFSSEPRPNTH